MEDRAGAVDAHAGGDEGRGRLAADALRPAGDERDAIRMVVVEGRSYAEAARSLGVSVTTINNWKHRGLEKLRARYGRRETG